MPQPGKAPGFLTSTRAKATNNQPVGVPVAIPQATDL